MLDTERLLERLNPPQREAVTHAAGPLLILAGAGSGKTRVITCRIAWLVGRERIAPHEIVAVTFTNKAAAEMRERAEQLLGQGLTGAFLGTFHSFGLRLLRANAAAAGLAPNFVIYDTADQGSIIRQALKDVGLDDKTVSPKQALGAISRWKNAFVDPDRAAADALYDQHRRLADAYRVYEQALRRSGALDFDDLLVQPVRLFAARPDVLEKYARRIRFLLVDEYQDTNPLQYRLIHLLAGHHRNICCVGDEDQSIYAFRGADIRNILDFTRDFPDARVVKLEQNYRSTGNILAAASAVIRNNSRRHDKTLWTEGAKGERVRVHTARDDRAEADFIVAEMLRRSRESGVALDQMAVLYRTNAISRLVEDRLVANRIPYRVVGSLRFYERREIKDLLAWLRLLVHPDSDQDFLRAAGTPPRGLGDKTLDELAVRAAGSTASLFAAAKEAVAAGAGAQRSLKALGGYLDTIRDLADLSKTITTAATLQAIIDVLDYNDYLEKAHPADHAARAENVGALLAAAREHDEAGAPDGLAGFLDRVTLRSDTDDVQGQRGPSLMTVHSAKGLEFDGVFIAGLNEEIFPHALANADADGIEEERRLMYVALTRARKFLVLTLARERRPFGRPISAPPSRFLAELPAELVHETGGGFEGRSETGPYAGRAAGGFGGRGAPSWRGGGDDDVPRGPATRPAGISGGGGPRRVEPEPSGDAPFRPGMTVIHPMFGRGKILSAEGEGQRLKLQIRFDRVGLKKIMAHATTLIPG